MTKSELKNILPHREPMLLLNEVELIDGISVGRYTVGGDEYFLQGHFPDNPVVPGVILCEMMAQSACLLVNTCGIAHTPYLTGIKNMKFIKKVVPGDSIVFKVEMKADMDNFYFVKGIGYVDDEICISGELSFACVEEDMQ